MGDAFHGSRRQETAVDTWKYWEGLLGQPLALAECSRERPATGSSRKSDVTSVRSLSRCCSLDVEDPLFAGIGIGQYPAPQPGSGSQDQQGSEEQSTIVLQSRDNISLLLGSNFFDFEQAEQPFMGGGDLTGLAAYDSSGNGSSSDDPLQFLKPLQEEDPIQQEHPLGSSAAAAALQDGVIGPFMTGACQAPSAEEPPRVSSEMLCTEVGSSAADHMLDDIFMQAASSESSGEWFSTAQPQPQGSLPAPQQQQQPAQSSAMLSRKRGRPRRYDTTLPLGQMDAHAAAACSTVNGVEAGVRKRGAKPKYKFLTAQEAVAHRRERNRSTAIATHEKKKAREQALKAELDLRQSEHDALHRLLEYVKQPAADTEMVRKLLLGEEGAQGSICDAMEFVLTTHTA